VQLCLGSNVHSVVDVLVDRQCWLVNNLEAALSTHFPPTISLSESAHCIIDVNTEYNQQQQQQQQ